MFLILYYLLINTTHLKVFFLISIITFLVNIVFQKQLSIKKQTLLHNFTLTTILVLQTKQYLLPTHAIYNNCLISANCNNLFTKTYNYYLNLGFFFSDWLTIVFSTTTLLIGIFANIFSFFYLKSDLNIKNFLNFLNLFILSMLFLTYSNSILIVLFSWEFLGISSFFLINHYNKRAYSLKSAYKAFCFNRFSDIVFFLFTVCFIFNFNTTLITTALTKHVPWNTTFLYSLLLITASVKSAQNVFFFWLPDSMEAPIPASALIHSATLVSAGIYLVIRFYTHISTNYLLLLYLKLSGLLTAVVFSTVSYLQTDIKRLLAYSTIANCGYMYFLIGVGCINEVLVFFIMHGLLKSMLFMVCGNLIILNNHSQDFQTWSDTTSNNYLIKMFCFCFLMLGGVNLTFSYEIKHLFAQGSFFNNKIACFLTNYLLTIYTINSFLYSTKFLLKTTQFNNTKTEFINNKILNFKLLELFIITTIVIILKFLFFIKKNISISYNQLMFIDQFKSFYLLLIIFVNSKKNLFKYFFLFLLVTTF